jgi:chromosome segregation ATPase
LRLFARGSKVRHSLVVAHRLSQHYLRLDCFHSPNPYSTTLVNFVSTSTEKLEKEKNRCKELEREKEGQEIVIEKLSEEYHDAMNELNQLQAQEGARMQSLDEQSRQQLEKEKSSLVQQHLKQIEDSVRREEEYTLQIRKLRNEIEELLNEQTSHMHEQNRWEEEKQSLLAKLTEKDFEIRRAMDDLEELNSENADYLQKIEVYTNSMDSFEESRVKYR